MSKRQIQTLPMAFFIFVRYPSPILLVILFLGFVITRCTQNIPLQIYEVLGIFCIALYWPLQEWWMHKILLHLPDVKFRGKKYEMKFAKTHRLHHESPKNIALLFLPISVVLGALVFFSALFYYMTLSITYMCTWMAMASFSTLLYEWTHYLTHTDYKPKGQYYKTIWKLHRWHHYKNENYWFSFTIPWIDKLFGTGPNPKDIPQSATVLSLKGEKDL
jgi:sterol desaturase/sphingolipid hydroxylase (fatty acid hydroxylase superfamily)